ncbi:MAG: helix-turn-helix transcriptional regulator [Clostridia bacterium]|nr:helix-turn-helix transcriptional regulator [Clostridia bacterium]
MDYVKLGIRIRNCRKKLHYTQEQLSELAGISLSFLGHIERGTRKASLETIVSLCNSMNISPELLLQDSLNADILGIPKQDTRKRQDFLKEISDVMTKYMDDDEQ